MNAIPPIDPTAEEENRTARHLRHCQELAELGMALARTAAQQAAFELAATPTDPTTRHKTPSATLAFTRLCRLVLQTLALEARLAGRPAPANRIPRPPKPAAPRPQPKETPIQFVTPGAEIDPATHPDEWLGVKPKAKPAGTTPGMHTTVEDALSYLRTRFPNPRQAPPAKPPSQARNELLAHTHLKPLHASFRSPSDAGKPYASAPLPSIPAFAR